MGDKMTEKERFAERVNVSWRAIIAIFASALVLGVAVFAVSLSRDASLRVFGFVEVARAYTVDMNGSISSDSVIDPALVVRALNVAEQGRLRSDNDGGELGERVALVARIARGGSLIELEASSSSFSAAEGRINEAVEEIRKLSGPMRENALTRLNAQESESLKEIRRLGELQRRLEGTLSQLEKGNNNLRDSVSMVVIGMMHANTERQLHDVERLWRAYLMAMQLMEERKTRLVVPILAETDLPFASVTAGLVGFFVGLLAAVAVFFVRRTPPAST